MERTTGRRRWGLGLWIAIIAFLGQACLSFDTFCEERSDCMDGNEADTDACIVGLNAEEDQASLYGCTEWFEVYYECLEAEAQCENDVYGLQGDDCDDEQREYSSCMGDDLPGNPFPF